MTATVRALSDAPGHSKIHGPFADAAQRLRIDAATAEVLRAFEAVGVGARLLKGRTFLEWLYQDGGRRTYLDVDLLVRPGDEAAAEAALARLGFVQSWDESALPDWWQEHGSEWIRRSDAVLVDLHRNLVGIGADAHTAWTVLADPAPTVAVGGYDAPALATPARALHVSLHAAQHGSEFGKGLDDLEKALTMVPDTTWKEAAVLADRVDAIDAFAAGLRLSPEGGALADRLGLPEPASVEVRLRAETAPPVALGVEQLVRAGSWRARVEILARKLVPPPEFMRHWDPRAAEGPWSLALAYVRRPFWVLRHAPAGVRAWWRARRRVGRRPAGDQRIPEDPVERQAWLERWAAEQQRREAKARPLKERLRALRRRLRKRTALAIEMQMDRLDRRFDRALDTSAHVYDVPEITAVDGVVYVPTAWHVLPLALRTLHAGRDDVLLDFGCGKGRILHQAAKRPLRRVIGVEINPQLADFARQLVAAHRREYRCRDIEIVVANAAQFVVPDDVTIAFMFDPFRGSTLDDALRNLIASVDRTPRRLTLIYVNPTQGDRVLATGRFQLVRWQRGGLYDVRMRRAAIFECS